MRIKIKLKKIFRETRSVKSEEYMVKTVDAIPHPPFFDHSVDVVIGNQ
jgi:hypothetical protein